MFPISFLLLYFTAYIYTATMINPQFLQTSFGVLKDSLTKQAEPQAKQNNLNQIDLVQFEVCATEVCSKESEKMLNTMDESVNPCEDFYEFACGKLLRDTELPSDKYSQTAFTLTQDKVDRQMRSILTDELQPHELKPFKLAKLFTKTCMDEKTLNEKGISPMEELLEKYGGWPVIKGDDWNSENWDWLNTSRRISNDGLIDLILDCHIEVEPRNSSKHILTINRAEFGLTRRALVKGMDNGSVRDYWSFMVDAAVMFGANKTRAQIDLYIALQLEIVLAKISLTAEELNDISVINNPFSIEQLQEEYPDINWIEYFNGCTRNLVPIDKNEVVIVVDTDYLKLLTEILNVTPKRVVANYMGWRLVFFGSTLLNDALYQRNRQYFSEDAPISDIRLTECVKKTMQYLEISVGAIYVRKYFDEHSKSEAINITKSIHEEFINNLKRVSWMDEKSRAAAIAKANAMHFNIAYPNELADDRKLEEYYRGLELRPDSLIHSVMNIRKFTNDHTIGQLRQPINKTDWKVHSIPTKVGGYYSVSENSIQLPAASLQEPFFLNDRPSYLNFGGIGFFVAHEITHGFDATGRQYDPNGNLVDWWDVQTVENFTLKTQCFIDQYSSYKDPILNMKVNGVRTLDENIADNGGIKGMYAAYQMFVRQHGADPILPGLQYTPNQLFWISAAQTWCSVGRPIFDILNYQINVHAPNRYRVIGSFSNMRNFSSDFNCAPGSFMNPVDKCQIW